MARDGMDLNALLPLKVLLEEANVTRAGQRLSLSQPAMSAALARLRRRFDDELLVRSGRDYELTAFARELLPEVQHALRVLGVALELEETFDPRTATRRFRLAMSDYAVAVMHGPLIEQLEGGAPGVQLAIDPLPPDARESERTLVDYDVVIAPLGLGFPGRSAPLWHDRMVVIADRDNPRAAGGGLTVDDLMDLPHASAGFGAGTFTPVDRAFEERSLERRIVLQVAGYLPLLFVIEGTDMVALLPERLARLHVRETGRLVVLDCPLGEVALNEGYWVAPDRFSDPAHRWLHGVLDTVGSRLSEA